MDKIRQFYFGNNVKINATTSIHLVQLLNDVYMNYNIDQGIKMHINKSMGRTYYYR